MICIAINDIMTANNYKLHRKSIRLPAYDYSGEGAYYVTICTQDRKCIFGQVIDGRMQLNEWGRIANDEITKTGELRPNVIIDTYVVMPNHVHLIIVITGDDKRRDMARHVPTMGKRAFGKPKSGSLSTIIGAIESSITRNINISRKTHGETIWQGRFYEHIIRNDNSYETIRQYILENPLHWAQDDENPERKSHNAS